MERHLLFANPPSTSQNLAFTSHFITSDHISFILLFFSWIFSVPILTCAFLHLFYIYYVWFSTFLKLVRERTVSFLRYIFVAVLNAKKPPQESIQYGREMRGLSPSSPFLPSSTFWVSPLCFPELTPDSLGPIGFPSLPASYPASAIILLFACSSHSTASLRKQTWLLGYILDYLANKYFMPSY